MEDIKIIELYWNRSETAIIETKNKYGRLCKQIALNIVLNNEDAEECVNDTYLGAWNAMPPQKPDCLSAYICRIARNLALKKRNFNNAQKRDQHIQVTMDELEECIIGSDNVEQLYEAKAIAKLVSDFLRTLDYESRNVFLRRYWFFDSITDIRNRFSMSESKVKSVLFRTRIKLKNYLAKEGVNI